MFRLICILGDIRHSFIMKMPENVPLFDGGLYGIEYSQGGALSFGHYGAIVKEVLECLLVPFKHHL